MKTITVFGANGRVGSIVVQELVKRGYRVRAFVYHNDGLKDTPEITYIQGDVADKMKVSEALNGADAVVSALGSWNTKQKNILTAGMKVIVPLMEKYGIRRIVSLTGADAWRSEQYQQMQRWQQLVLGTANRRPLLPQAMSHTLFSVVAGKILKDGEAHIAVLEQSNLDWTVLRSPVMNTKGVKDSVLGVTYPWPWETIHREAVAVCLVEQLDQTEWIKKSPYIRRK